MAKITVQRPGSMPGLTRYKCHRARLKTAQRGVMLEPIDNYKTWGYFCGHKGGGWTSTPCACTELTTLK